MSLKWYNLRTRTTFYFLLIFLIPTAILGSLAYSVGSNELEKSAREKLESLIISREQSILSALHEEKQFIEVLVEIPLIQNHAANLLSPETSDKQYKDSYRKLLEYLNIVLQRMNDIEEISILNSIGARTILSTNEESVGKYHLSDSFFNLGREKTYVQKIHNSKKHLSRNLNHTNHPNHVINDSHASNVIATPLKDLAGKTIGVFYIHLQPQQLENVMQNFSGLGETGETYAVDMYNSLLTNTRMDKRGIDTKIKSYGIEQALDRNNGSGLYLNHRGQEVLGFYRWLEEPQIAIIAEISRDEVFKPIADFEKIILVAGIILSVLTTLFALFFSGKISRPIVALAKSASKVAEGDFSEKITVSSKDEIGNLVASFNLMRQQLGDMYNNLEYKVITRTKDIENVARVGEYLSTILNQDKLCLEIIDQLKNRFAYKDANVFLSGKFSKHLNATEKSHIESIDQQLNNCIENRKLITNIEINNNNLKHKIWISILPITPRQSHEATGALIVCKEESFFDDTAINTLRSLVSHFSIALQNAQAFSAIEQAKQEWEVAFGAINDGVVLTGIEGDIQRSNAAFNLLLNKNNDEIAFNSNIKEIIKPLIHQSNDQGLSIDSPIEYQKQLNNLILNVHGYPVYNDNGQASDRLVIVIRDVTEKFKAEESLKQFSIELQRSNKELEEFAYVASHDLQEPLRKIQSFGDRLASKFSEELPDQGSEYIERMRNAAARMQLLINGLLDYSRITTKAVPFEKVDLNEIVRDVVSDLEIRINDMGARVLFENLPTIEADSLHMRQLFQNLIGNALKFTKPDTPPIVEVISDQVHDEALGDSVQIVIKDNGIGFDNKYADKIFGVFQRLHGRAEYEGSGIGLSIVRKIVERHGGSITPSGVLSEGATFKIILPLNPTAKTTS